jgi:hypothetical protein
MDSVVDRRAVAVSQGGKGKKILRVLFIAVLGLPLSCCLFWQLTAERLLSCFAVNESISGVAKSGDRLYLVCGDSWEPTAFLEILDVSDPVAPAYVGKPYSFTKPTMGMPSISVSVDRVFLSDSNLLVVDVSNPSAPSTVKSFSLGGSVRESTCSVAGGYLVAVVNNPPDLLLKTYALSDLVNPTPPSPVPAGSLTVAGVGGIGDGQVVIAGNILYLFSQSAFTIVDLAAMSNPVLVSMTVFSSPIWDGKGLALTGNCAYLSYAYEEPHEGDQYRETGDVMIFDVSAGAAPRYVDHLEGVGATMAISANYLLSQKTNSFDPVRVHDISDVFSPRPVASLNVRKTGDWILPVGDYALVLDNNQIATALIAPYR